MRTKEFRLILTILLALLGMQAKAEDRVVIQSAEVEAGEEFFLPVELVNDRIYKAFQMDIVPARRKLGITVVYFQQVGTDLFRRITGELPEESL